MSKKFLHHSCKKLNLGKVCEIGKKSSRILLPKVFWKIKQPSSKLLKNRKSTFVSIYTQSKDTTTIRQPTDIQKNAKRNTIQLLAKKAVSGTGLLHYYYLYTDNNGKQTYLSAYPQNNNFPWGKLVTKTGTYKSGTPDYKASVLIGTISGDAQDVANTFQGLKSEFTRVENARIDYNSYGNGINNSNAVATTALYNCVSNSQIQLQNNEGPRDDSNLDDRAPGQSTQVLDPAKSKSVEKNLDSSTTQQHQSILAMYSADGKATGQIDVKKMIQELQKANYSQADIIAVLNTMYEIQQIPEAQRSQLATAAIDGANQTVATAPIADGQKTL